MKIFKLAWKGLVWLWRKIFPKKYRAIKPAGTVSLITGTSSGVEPLSSPMYIRRIKDDTIKK